MAKSELAKALDETQAQFRDFFKESGFRKHGRTYNRTLPDGLAHVVNFQMGASDPPGTTYIPGLRENLYGLFTLNLGVFVPEVAEIHGGGLPGRVIHDYNCCIRSRLSELQGANEDIWWHIPATPEAIANIRESLEHRGVAFFDRFASRQAIIESYPQFQSVYRTAASAPPNLVVAVVQSHLGNAELAREALVRQLREPTRNPGHPQYVKDLAQKLGLGEIAA